MNTPSKCKKVVLNPNAKIVLQKRYLKKNLSNDIAENEQELFWRVASAIAKEEEKYSSNWKSEDLALAFYDMMTDWKFLPNSPTLMNAGTSLGQLSACFVLPIGDSIEEIFDAIKYAALIHKSGGGTGFSFSRIRASGSSVGSTGGVASGPLSFLKIFNTATEQIKQGGTRRGANMGILRVDHPDILEFIYAKEKEGEFNNFNLSVALTEKFMQSVEKDQEYPLIDPVTGKEIKRLKARDVFTSLVEKAWKSGDPGIVFLDRINRDNPTPDLGEIESTNPCGEQPLLPYEACNLGSINLAQFYSSSEKGDERIQWNELRTIIHLAVRFLDNVIDASRFPLESIAEMVRQNRKIGLGVMGWADLLYQMEIPYDSNEAIELAGKIMKFIRDEGRKASAFLAEERGVFPEYPNSIYAKNGVGPLRNATVTTIAPTGTLSIIAGCSSGVEPLFALCFSRNVMDGERLVEVNPYFEESLRQNGLHSTQLMDQIAAKGSIASFTELPENIRRVFVTAMDISPFWHLKMQATFQAYTDNAVSKTVNLPHSATVEDIWNIYWMAYELGCKGVTVYRDGCKSSQVLNTGTTEAVSVAPDETIREIRDRPELMSGFTQKVNTGYGAMYVTINELDGKPFEVFATVGKSGRSTMAKAEAIGRLISLAFRSGLSVEAVVRQIRGISGEKPVFQSGRNGLVQSIPDGIAWVLEERYLKDTNSLQREETSLGGNFCPDCQGTLIFQEGCLICPNCAFTKCG